MAPRRARARLAALPLCIAATAAPAAEPPPAAATQSVIVVGTTALPGVGTPLDRIPANVQVVPVAAGPHVLTLAQALDQEVGSVDVNDTAGNALQLDVDFRGFTASPALGTPQGLSVFVDGVRVNEVFGDTVNWDLIPVGAVARIAVMPGADPLFGLNTLGGALAVTLRDGFEEDGLDVRAHGGTWGRRALDVAGGTHGARLAVFAAANLLQEDGWAERDPSRVAQLYARAGWRDGGDRADLALTLAGTRLEGSQTLPLSWQPDFRAAYTWPDVQSNRLAFLVASASRRVAPDLLLEGNAFHRRLRGFSSNSNVNGDYDPARPPGPGNAPTTNAFDDVDQSRAGASLQLTSTAPLAGRANHLALGMSVERGFTRFAQSAQEAGAARDTRSSAPVLLATLLHARASAAGLHASDTLGLAPHVFVDLAGRYDVADVALADQLGTALDGHHRFHRFNPALGLTAGQDAGVTIFAGYNEGMRVPTPVELSCADPQAPCSLPNAFVSDPALRPVVARNGELGARGRGDGGLAWSVAVFRTALSDDIQFVSSGGGASSAGYFRNVGHTRRQGLELALSGAAGRLDWRLRYGLVDATYRTPLVVASPDNSSAAALSCAACADIRVRPGNHLPGIPRHTLKLHLRRTFGDAASLGATFVAQGGQYARGDEDNADVHGRVPGFGRMDLEARAALGRGWEAFANIDNVFDRRTSTFGSLGRNEFTGPGRSFDPTGATWRSEQFRTAGAPRGIWLGVAWHVGRTSADDGP